MIPVSLELVTKMTSLKIDTQENRDALFSAWSPEKPLLRFTEIRDHLIDKKIIRYKSKREELHTKVNRWLKVLLNEKALEKEKGSYRLKLNPQEFQLFNYLRYLRKKGPIIYEGSIGGSLWKACALSVLGFPANSLKDEDTTIAFNILLIRLGEIFKALEYLRNVVAIRKVGMHISIPDPVDREVFFAFLSKHIGDEGTTDELVTRYKKNLEKYYNDTAKEYWPALYSRSARKYFFDPKIYPRPEGDFHSFVEWTTQMKNVEKNLERIKNGLKDEDFYVDKHELEGPQGLLNRLKAMEKNIGGKEADYSTEKSDVFYQLKAAVLIKIVEELKKMKINLEDFAVILTHPPSVMDKFYTAEHVLYDAMEWAIEEPRYKFLRSLWLDKNKELESTEAMIVHYLTTAQFSVEDYRKLRNKPWVLKRLSKFADFDELLRLYEKKYVKRIKKQQKIWEETKRENKGTKTININKELKNIGK